jgi:hypothetical protein
MKSHESRPPDTEPLNSRGGLSALAFAALHPVSVIASVSTNQPIERLMALQSAVARGVDLVIQAGRLRPRLSAHGWPRLQLR